jgi:hypothetical protein
LVCCHASLAPPDLVRWRTNFKWLHLYKVRKKREGNDENATKKKIERARRATTMLGIWLELDRHGKSVDAFAVSRGI